MLLRIDDFEAGKLSSGRLLDDLRGLFIEADPHSAEVRDQFEEYWSEVDREHELQTEAWSPTGGAASAQNLASQLGPLRLWIEAFLNSDTGDEHN
ncbi:MAG: hypothetical protein AAF962_10670 [Actinomycetota bacterium]